jgi:hypothetical protein
MKMHLLSGGRLRTRKSKSIFVPDADCSETIELSVSCVLLTGAKMTLRNGRPCARGKNPMIDAYE